MIDRGALPRVGGAPLLAFAAAAVWTHPNQPSQPKVWSKSSNSIPPTWGSFYRVKRAGGGYLGGLFGKLHFTNLNLSWMKKMGGRKKGYLGESAE